MSKITGSRVIVALDYPSAREALDFVSGVDPQQCRLKVGKELFTRSGPALVEQLVGKGFDVFLDLKFHDIPNTVAQACRAAADLGVWMMNVHASGGLRMMSAAREALEDRGGKRPLLIAVTVLTSMGAEDLAEIGLSVAPADQVVRLADLAAAADLDGVVCSPKESALLRSRRGRDFLLVTPGVRPAGSATGDQKRVLTPEEAVRQGSDYLVIGRPVTQAADPVAVLAAINESLAGLT